MSTPSERLATARAIRVRQAQFARLLGDARIALAHVLRNKYDTLGSASITYVLRHTPGLGPKGTEKVLREAKVWPEKRVRDLTDAEVQAILRCLPPRVIARQAKFGRSP